jgi:hypothetical protein
MGCDRWREILRKQGCDGGDPDFVNGNTRPQPPVKSRGGDVVRNHSRASPTLGNHSFSFGIIAPWPAAGFYSDAVYVDSFGGGYYLCNPRHPGVRLALSVEDPAAPVQDGRCGSYR